MIENHREPEVPEVKVRVVECRDGLARITLEELAITHFVKNGTLQNACSTRPRAVVGLGKSAHSHIVRLMNSRQKGLERMMTKVLWLLKKGNWQEREFVIDECHDRPGKLGKRSDKKLGQNSSKRQSSDARQLGCVFQDMTPPKSILRKGTDMPKPIQRVKFTKAIARHTKIRDQNPSLGYICPGEPHQRSPNAPKFEDRSLEETEWQAQGAREAAWKLATSVIKLKKHERAIFFSPSENSCLRTSTLKPEGRELVVDSGASIHMISKKDLSNAEMDTLTKSCSPTTVITANGEDGIRIIYNTENFVLIVVPGLSSSSSASSSTLRTPMKQESHSSSSSSPSPSSPTVGEIPVREREDAPNSDVSPVPVSELVDDRSGKPEEIQANEIPKTNQKETTIERGNPCGDSEIPERLQEFR